MGGPGRPCPALRRPVESQRNTGRKGGSGQVSGFPRNLGHNPEARGGIGGLQDLGDSYTGCRKPVSAAG